MGALVPKSAMTSPILLRLVVLVFATIFGVHICLICLRQISARVNPKLMIHIKGNEQACKISGIHPGESLHVHFPKPKTFSREECVCNPVRNFAILSMQRSGSGWFETFLNSHMNVSSNGEIFSVKERRHNISMVFSTLDKVYNLDWSSSAAKNECSAAVGFKWMLNQGVLTYHNEIVDYFNRHGVSAIFLFRRNFLRRMISILANSYDRDVKLLNGTHKSHVHSEKEAKVLAQYKPSINVSLLLPDLQRAAEMANNALEYFKSTKHIILYYEDLAQNHTKLMDAQDFLSIPRMKLRSRQKRIHTKPLPEQIDNWKDVYNTLKGTEYENFLELNEQPV